MVSHPAAAPERRTDDPAQPPDRAAWLSLTGPHAHVAIGSGRARRYPADVSPFVAVEDPDDEQSWLDLRALCQDDERVIISGAPGFARTLPGPLGRGGGLVALAGERLHPAGWSEISAVCTDPDHRGQGLATRLVPAVAHLIRERGETPFRTPARRTSPPSTST